jgi:hypothetical protein
MKAEKPALCNVIALNDGKNEGAGQNDLDRSEGRSHLAAVSGHL